jgi:hypothetical protein
VGLYLLPLDAFLAWAGRTLLFCVTSQEAEGKRRLGKPRRRWEDNVKIDLKDMGCRGMDWIELA